MNVGLEYFLWIQNNRYGKQCIFTVKLIQKAREAWAAGYMDKYCLSIWFKHCCNMKLEKKLTIKMFYTLMILNPSEHTIIIPQESSLQ